MAKVLLVFRERGHKQISAARGGCEGRVILGLAKGKYVAPSDEGWAAMDAEIEHMVNGGDEELPGAAA